MVPVLYQTLLVYHKNIFLIFCFQSFKLPLFNLSEIGFYDFIFEYLNVIYFNLFMLHT